MASWVLFTWTHNLMTSCFLLQMWWLTTHMILQHQQASEKQLYTAKWLALSLCVFLTNFSQCWWCDSSSLTGNLFVMFHFAAKCALKPDTGPCDQRIQRWYFNAKKKKCEEFLYGGCKGNLNRFITEDTCVATCLLKGTGFHLLDSSWCLSSHVQCVPLMKSNFNCPFIICITWDVHFSCFVFCRDIWFQTANSGGRLVAQNCNARFRLWQVQSTDCSFLPIQTKAIELFPFKVYAIWRRILGLVIKKLKSGFSMPNWRIVRNLHMEVAREISTDLPLWRNAKKPAQQKLTKVHERFLQLYFHKGSTWSVECAHMGIWKEFLTGLYGSSSGVVAVEKSISQTSTGKSFLTLMGGTLLLIWLDPDVMCTCYLVSFSLNELLSAKCSLKQDSGPCNEKIQRWYFNAQKKKCEQFIYGGCKGNLNRFITAETCKKTCLPTGTYIAERNLTLILSISSAVSIRFDLLNLLHSQWLSYPQTKKFMIFLCLHSEGASDLKQPNLAGG